MKRALGIRKYFVALAVAVIALLAAPCPLGAQGISIIELDKVQVAKTLGGKVVGPDQRPIEGVDIIEVTSDWRTTLRATKTEGEGRWSLAPIPHRQIYYLRFVMSGFNEVRCRVRVSKVKGKKLQIELKPSA